MDYPLFHLTSKGRPVTDPTLSPVPTNGLDRCECGSKYWTPHYTDPCGHSVDYYTCFDCGERFDPTNVHTEHCCADHGCKYGDDDCTVTTGNRPQSFPCEWCSRTYEEVDVWLPHATDDQLFAELKRRGFDTAQLNRTRKANHV